MAAVSLAILGKNNEPLYIKEFIEERKVECARYSDEELFGLPASMVSGKHGENILAQQRRGSLVAGIIDCSIQQQFILHAALDRFEQLSGPPPGYSWRVPGVTGTDAMFVGLLNPVDHIRVYGYMTTTQIRFLLAVDDQCSRSASLPTFDQKSADDSIKRLFVKLHRLYVEYMLNPFGSLTGPITSIQFDVKVQECVAAFNRSVT